MLLNSYFMSWPKEYLLFSVNLPVAMSGGHISFSMGIASFITEISSPEQRTFRLASVHFVKSLGGPVGTKIGAYLWDKGGYMVVFGVSLAGKFITLIILVIRLMIIFELSLKRIKILSISDLRCSSGDQEGLRRKTKSDPKRDTCSALDTSRTLSRPSSRQGLTTRDSTS